jgi:hypothetical protein
MKTIFDMPQLLRLQATAYACDDLLFVVRTLFILYEEHCFEKSRSPHHCNASLLNDEDIISISERLFKWFYACFFAALKKRSIMTASLHRALFCSVSEHPCFSSIIMFF